MSEEIEEYPQQQMELLAEELNRLQMSYDTRLLAAFLAGRAGRLHAMLVKSGHMTMEDAQKIWKFAGDQIENPPEQEVKTMTLMDGQIFDPDKAN